MLTGREIGLSLFSFRLGLRWQRVLLIAVTMIASLYVGMNITNSKVMAVGLTIPMAVLGLAVWRCIPRPRAFNVGRMCLALMPLVITIPQRAKGMLRFIPGLNTLINSTVLALIVCGLAALLFMRTLARRERFGLPAMVWSGLGLFLLGGLVALIGAARADYARDHWASICLLGASALYLSIATVRRIEQAEQLLGALVAGLVAYGCGLLFLLWGQAPGVVASANWLLRHGRLGGVAGIFGFSVPFLGTVGVALAGNAPQVGELLAMGLVVAVAYALNARSRRGRSVALVGTCLLAILMVMTNSRGAILAGAVGAGVVCAASLTWRASTAAGSRMWVPPILALTVFVAVRLWSQLSLFGGELNQRLVELGDVRIAYSFTSRTARWQTAWSLLRFDLFGIGFGGPTAGYLNPHNLWLWLLQGTGVIGLLGFLIAIAGVLPAIWRGLRHSDPRRRTVSIAALGVLGVALVAGMASIFFHGAQHTVPFWAVMGVVLALDRQSSNPGL